ncbi:aldehyde dehydrogenase family protein [Microbulbifer pacificus]|uniref:L-glutamate gamma-semialdehyde dehydrogenase n=1 Tax=Microbulbifer pacificus TaxID=407164 RepID=A0AAU0N2H5_9GAMM|nr:aldehyde dehydrogenase family protein [Microbulbifer pacificus]WOX07224.1 aldehyde dehydrogenase family protein [Microbulbifer pacificus]
MSFKLTYATMFNPPEEMHQRYEAALAELSADLGGRFHLYIDGEDRPAEAYDTRVSPLDRELVLGEFAAADSADVDAAMGAAQVAFKGWRHTPAAERIAIMRRIADLLDEEVYLLAAALTLETGKNRFEALGEAQETADFFRVYADSFEQQGFDHMLPNDPLPDWTSTNRSVMKPYGAWVVIVPFNFPLALAGGPVAAALVTGNTVVLKGASHTPLAGRLLADCLHRAGLPAGVFNYLSGPGSRIGDALVAHPSTAGVTFTGSYEVGMRISRFMVAGRYPRPCIAEMGGKNPCIVTRNADLERAAIGIVRSAFGMGGQKCSALSRLYVHSAVADELIARIKGELGKLNIGDPRQRENWLGPVTTAQAHANYARYAAQLGESAEILHGGRQLDDCGDGYYVEPLLAEASLEHPLWREEMFLPILLLARVDNFEQALELANDTDLGLTAGVYGDQREVNQFLDEIEAGVTYVNRPQGATTGAWPGYQCFGGWKGSGTTGKAIGSFYYLALYQREQSHTIVE